MGEIETFVKLQMMFNGFMLIVMCTILYLINKFVKEHNETIEKTLDERRGNQIEAVRAYRNDKINEDVPS